MPSNSLKGLLLPPNRPLFLYVITHFYPLYRLGMTMVAAFRRGAQDKRGTPFLSIRGRLVVLALLIVVPLMVDRVRLLKASRSERIASTASEVLQLTRHGAEGQREIITTVRAMLQVTARAYVAVMARGDTCNLNIRDVVGNMPCVKD